jgi:hypothetical protein
MVWKRDERPGSRGCQRLMTATDARACPSSAIPSALAQLDGAAPLGDAEAGHLLGYLATIHDPRAPAGRRHPLVTTPPNPTRSA